MTRTQTLLLWTPRAAAAAMALFLSLFALDAFNGTSMIDAIPRLLVHLGPAFLVLALLAVAWRFLLTGATRFLLLAMSYAVMVLARRLDRDHLATAGGTDDPLRGQLGYRATAWWGPTSTKPARHRDDRRECLRLESTGAANA
jgi:hypothetical protein